MSHWIRASATLVVALVVSATASAREHFGGPVRYDCGSMATGLPEPNVDPLLESLAHLAGKPEGWLAASVLAYAESIDPESLDLETRLLAQNFLYRVAADGGDRTRRHAAGLVLRFAPDASVFAAIGVEPDPAIDVWLGPSDAWMERTTTFCGNGNLLVHDRILEGAVAFRPVRHGETRALVGQIVAFDDQGRAHVTPIVERVEMRRGLAVDAPACVAHLDPGVTGAPRIVPTVEALHPDDHFVFRQGTGVGCAGCHSRNDVFKVADVPDARAARELLDARRERVETLATERLRAALQVE